MNHYWTACHTQPGAEWKARQGIEEAGFGTFLPAYAKRSERKTRYFPLMPGYVMVAIDAANQDSIGEIHRELIDGVDCLLGRVSDAEVERVMAVHALGKYDEFQPRRAANGQFSSSRRKQKKRRRRPRHGRKTGLIY